MESWFSKSTSGSNQLQAYSYPPLHFFVIIFIFCLSRFIVYIAGIQFQFWPAEEFWQVLDLYYLEHDYFDSIYYLYSQPPVLNILIGAVLSHFGYSATGPVLNFLFLFLSLATFLYVYRFLLLFKAGESLCLLITVFLMLNPAVILYENHLYLTYIVFSLLIISMYYFYLVVSFHEPKHFVILGITLSLLALTRGTFHLVWLYLVVILLLMVTKSWKGSVIMFLIINTLVLPFYIKNLIVFDTFSLGSWPYMNLMKKYNIVHDIKSKPNPYGFLESLLFSGESELKALQAKLSQLNTVEPFSDVQTFEKYVTNYRKYGNPVTDHNVKKNGRNNYNHAIYLEVDKMKQKDFIVLLKHKPSLLGVGLFFGITNLFKTPTYYPYLYENKEIIPTFTYWNSLLFYGAINQVIYKALGIDVIKSTALAKLLREVELFNYTFFVLYGYLFFYSLGVLWRRQGTLNEVFNVFWSFTILGSLVLWCMFTESELYRMRFTTDYAALLLLANILSQRYAKGRQRGYSMH